MSALVISVGPEGAHLLAPTPCNFIHAMQRCFLQPESRPSAVLPFATTSALLHLPSAVLPFAMTSTLLHLLLLIGQENFRSTS